LNLPPIDLPSGEAMAADAATPGADAAVLERDEYDNRVRFFSEFLHSKRDEWEKKIDTELANHRYRIPIELKDLKKNRSQLRPPGARAPCEIFNPLGGGIAEFFAGDKRQSCQTIETAPQARHLRLLRP